MMASNNALQPIRVGTRDSRLAMQQTHTVIQHLGDHALFLKALFDVLPLKSIGDIDLNTPLSQLGATVGRFGVFVKELEHALLANQVDLAVHSLKDMPSIVPDGLMLLPFGPREDVRDAFIAKDGETSFFDLPYGATIGTSSIRRAAQLKKLRPDIRTENIRGNVQTRLRKLHEGDYDGMILAAAGLNRLGLSDLITHTFCPVTQLVPAVGQGVLGLETRMDAPFSEALKQVCDDAELKACVTLERAIMRELEGGCQLPLGCYARIENGELHLTLQLIAPDLSIEVNHSEIVEDWRDSDHLIHRASIISHDVLTNGGQAIKNMLM